MPTLNCDIPRLYCLLRKEFLYDLQDHHGEHVPVCVFGVASLYGRALGFHALTENGATFWRLPLHAFCHRADAPAMPLDWLQIWDCFSYEVAVTCFDRLAAMRLQARLKDRRWYDGQYLFTIDWYGSADAEEAGEGGHKCAHLIALDNGNYAALPNNCLRWLDPAFVTPYRTRPDYRINTHVWKVERGGVTDDVYFYDAGPAEPAEGAENAGKNGHTVDPAPAEGIH
jgi:hypothetical protein